MFVRRVVGKSMQPGLSEGTIVIGSRHRQPKTGDVVVAAHEGREIIKRIAIASYTASSYFLLGDNPSASTDSRHYGWFPSDSIKGVIIGRIAR